MNKKMGLILVELIAALILLNIALFLVVSFNHTPTFWLGYVLVTLAIFELAGATYLIYAKKNLKSRFMNYPIGMLAFICGVAFIVLGLVFIIFNGISLKTAMIISAVLLILNLLCFIHVDMARNEVTSVEGKVKQKTFYIDSLERDVRDAVAKAERESQPELKAELEKLANDIHYSDPMSSSVLAFEEENIQSGCAKLIELLDSDYEQALEECKKLRRLVQRRNEKCAMLK